MAQSYDLVVIGTGTAGGVAAHRCRAAGWRVAVVDQRPFGGTCALRGCDPKKVLVGAAEALDRVRRLGGRGLGGDATMDWAALMRFKRTFTQPVPEATVQRFTAAGIDTYAGPARFIGQRRLAVGEAEIEGRFVLIAAGAEPVPLAIEGAEHTITSDSFLELDSLPSRLAFIGGGYIAFEFGHLAARAGAEVAILHRGRRALKGFDADLVERLSAHTRAQGIDLRLGFDAVAVTEVAGGLEVRSATGDRVQADCVVHAAGRAAALDGLDLEAAGVMRVSGAIALNRFLQSESNPAVYAAGDAARRGPPLTPVASLEGRAVASNMLEGNRISPDYTGIPTVVFSLPPLAAVGLTEAAAAARGLDVEVRHEDTSGWYTARRVNERCAAYKTLIEPRGGRIVGAHLLGPEAAEVINVFALAIRLGLDSRRLHDAVFAYPTAGSDIGYMT